jgi:hypothetical protein
MIHRFTLHRNKNQETRIKTKENREEKIEKRKKTGTWQGFTSVETNQKIINSEVLR